MSGALPDINTLTLGIAMVLVFLAAIVRGYSGFGFSLLAISSLSLIYKPIDIIPSMYLLEIAASLHLLPSIWKEIHWRSLVPLTLGCLIATPVGLWLLAHVPARSMQVSISIFVLVATVLLWRGYKLKTMPNTAATFAAGAASGLANGATGIGGPPVIIFYFASPAGPLVGRASAIIYFIFTDVIAISFMTYGGMMSTGAVTKAVFFIPALLAGVWLGARSFKTANPETFRKIVLGLLVLIAVAGLVKASGAI